MRIIPTTIKSRAQETAFTLTEVMMAATVILIIMLSLFLGLSMGFYMTRTSREDLRATQVILGRMEGVRLYNWNQIVYSNTIPTNFTENYYPMVTTTNASQGITYYGTFSISNVTLSPAASYSNDMRLVTVTVKWTNYFGNQIISHTRSLQSYVGQMGIQNYVYNN